MYNMKYYELEIDGVDKTGKDLIAKYIALLSNHKYSINCRGIITQIAYSIKFDRKYQYDISQLSKNKVFVLLEANKEDIEVRCKITNEPEFTIEKDLSFFYSVYESLKEKGYITLNFNTSMQTPYQIANIIIRYMENLNEKL